MKVLVTGASGFIGSAVVRHLVNEEQEVIAFDRRKEGHDYPAGVEVMLGDIRDKTSVHEAMAHSDAWIHLGGVLGTQETIKEPYAAAETNVLGGLNILNAAAHYKVPGVNIAVGNHWENNTYSITKTTVERFCQMFRKYNGLDVTVVRGMNVYGPRQSVAAPYGSSKVRKIMPSFVCRAIKGDPIEIYADPVLGSSIMDMIYIDDMAWVLVQALHHTMEKGPVETVIEAGPGRRSTVDEIAQMVIDEVGQGAITHLPMRMGETPGAEVVADPHTLKLINFDPERLTTLEQGLEPTVKYFREYLANNQ